MAALSQRGASALSVSLLMAARVPVLQTTTAARC